MSGYISKDFVHRGCGLNLSPELVWNSVPYSVQKNIKKAENNNIVVKKVDGTADDINILREIWYDPNDPNMPTVLKPDEYMFIAYNSNSAPIGAVILLPVSNHLFLNNLAGNEEGKTLRVQDYLLWHCVNYFKDSDFKYIDVGVSYRHTLYEFFKKWQTISYPVIFNVPKYKYNIGLNPFCDNSYNSDVSQNNVKNTEQKLSQILKGRKFTFIPDLNEARKICERLDIEFVENTFNFTDSNLNQPFVLDLTQIYSVQFGVLLVNIKLDDKSLWNDHRALDIFKREYVYSAIANEIEEFDVIIAKRKRNIEELNHFFNLEDICYIKQDEIIPSAYYFKSEFNNRYHSRLNDFGIIHYYNEENNLVGLPLHQNLSKFQLEYLYAIYRGVLNLCSEWVHTDYYSDLR
jgi:hypothetical protein